MARRRIRLQPVDWAIIGGLLVVYGLAALLVFVVLL